MRPEAKDAVISVRESDACMGAEIGGVDLSRPLPDRVFAEVRDALHRSHVLVFRGQSLQPQNFLQFANRFGKPEPHLLDQFHHSEYSDILVLSNVKKDGKPIGLADGGTYWHTDYSYLQIPARATLLYSIQVPKAGGDTLFADQQQAYEDLPETMKNRIDGLVTLNVYGNRDDPDLASRTSAFAPTPEQKQKRGATLIRHPLVRRHPYTGRKALYSVTGTSFAIEGMPDAEGLSLLRELAAHSTQPKYQYRVKYGVGDVVVWDNASVLHSATLTDPDDARTLFRITVKETQRPVA
ncbi:MAG TPA: TauD/TfdA family dioxygenase [Burkholderiales bacterium]|jgi:taurine dioxygenase|nr:TauD/TfdA family dioxygenase [Burkholderiales bacterium]